MTKPVQSLYTRTLAVLLALLLSASGLAQGLLAPRVLTVALFDAEADLWLERANLSRTVAVPGSFSPLRCNPVGTHCLVVTEMGTANATATLMALGLSERLDLRSSYVLVAGIAGVDPKMGTLGSAAWAEWVVDGDLAHEIDPRELPANRDYPFSRLGCAAGWCDEGWSAGTEVFRLNSALTAQAVRLSRDTELTTSAAATAYAARYPAGLPARAAPTVVQCDSLAASTYWHGARLSDWAGWWTARLTGGRGRYCMSNMEDSGVLTALSRLADAGRADLARVMVLRTASNFDQPYPGQSAQASIRADSGGFGPSIENAYRAGSAVTRYILRNWSSWQNGVPPSP